jgi:hypothetical protein
VLGCGQLPDLMLRGLPAFEDCHLSLAGTLPVAGTSSCRLQAGQSNHSCYSSLHPATAIGHSQPFHALRQGAYYVSPLRSCMDAVRNIPGSLAQHPQLPQTEPPRGSL